MAKPKEKLARQLKALGDPERLRILCKLPDSPRCEEVLNVSELSQELKISQPMVSHHLGVLRNAGLVQFEKMCRDVYYWIDRKEVDKVLAMLTEIVADKSVPPAAEG